LKIKMAQKKFFVFVLLGLMLVVLPFALAGITGNYADNINIERNNDGVLIIRPNPAAGAPADYCGNGIFEIAASEQCDGLDLGSQSCAGLGYASGDLSCESNCVYDTSLCVAKINDNSGGDGNSGSGGSSSGGSSSGSGSSGTCVESWSCDEWGTCEAGIESRSCEDVNTCGTVAIKPAEERGCSIAEINIGDEEGGFRSLFTGAVIGGMTGKSLLGILILVLVLIGAYWFVASKKKK
jgi:hypothetical protein